MREIKFKCWQITGYNFDEKPIWGMIDAEDLSFEEFKPLVDLLVSDPESEVFLQYTGLKDKNGREIYEGDIVTFHYFYQSLGANLGAQESEHELTGIVKWQEYGYGLSAIKGEHWRGYTGYDDGQGNSDFLLLAGMSESSIHEESFEILGNIYENPELLHSAQKPASNL